MNKKSVIVLTYWSYEDALIQTYTLPYVQMIRKEIPKRSNLLFVTFEKNKLSDKKINSIKRQLASENIVWLHFRYYPFGIRAMISFFYSFLSLLLICWLKEIDFIHAWCTPAGTVGYLLSSITRIPLIIDSFEPHAEAMVENGTWQKSDIAYKLLFYFEKQQAKKAVAVIAANKRMPNHLKEKFNISLKKNYTKPACVDLNLFSLNNRKKKELLHKYNFEEKIICLYAGKFGGIYYDKEVFELFKTAHEYWGDKLRILILTSHSEKEIQDFCKSTGLAPDIITCLFVPHKQIPDYMGLADFAITPVKPVPTKKYCSPIKDGEYWALGLPVIITDNISEDSDLIRQHSAGYVLDSLNKDSYLKAIKKIDSLLSTVSMQELYNHIRPIAEQNRNFSIAIDIYHYIYAGS